MCMVLRARRLVIKLLSAQGEPKLSTLGNKQPLASLPCPHKNSQYASLRPRASSVPVSITVPTMLLQVLPLRSLLLSIAAIGRAGMRKALLSCVLSLAWFPVMREWLFSRPRDTRAVSTWHFQNVPRVGENERWDRWWFALYSGLTLTDFTVFQQLETSCSLIEFIFNYIYWSDIG